MLQQFIENIVSALLTVLVFVALVWAFPAGAKNHAVTLDPALDEKTLKRLYRRAEWLALLTLFVWVGLCTWAVATILNLLAGWIVNLFGNAPYRILPPLQSWFFVGILFGSAWLKRVMDATIRYVMGQNAVDAMYIMTERMYQFNVAAAGRWFRKVLIILAITVTVFTVDTRIDVYSDRLVINDSFSLFRERILPFDALTAIAIERDTIAEKAILPPDPVYILNFKDGTDWKSDWFDFEDVGPAINYVAGQKGIAVDTVVVRH